MNTELIASIVRVLKHDGTTAGTGFVVSNTGLVATCSHVVQSEQSQQRGEPRPEYVDLVFHATDDRCRAKVESAWWKPAEAEDVAILRLEGVLPEGISPLLLGSSRASAGHSFCSRGYRLAEQFPEGLAAEGKIQGHIASKKRDGLQLLTNQIDEGMSGAPLWDLQARRVVGMINAFWETKRHQDAWLAFATPSEILQTVCPALQVSDLCPYQGLAAFGEANAEFFFGREEPVAELVDSLRRNPRFLAVVGPSGSGKSSVVHAGLIPALRKGEVSGSEGWHPLALRPGTDLFVALADAGLRVSRQRDLLEAVSRFLQLKPSAKRLVILIDQFEELFALCPQPSRARFLDQLLVVLKSNLPVTVILILRADFYGYLLGCERLLDWLKIGQVNLPPMGTKELRAVVEQPAQEVGLRFEPGLVETLVEDASRAEHSLPLLELALTQLLAAKLIDRWLARLNDAGIWATKRGPEGPLGWDAERHHATWPSRSRMTRLRWLSSRMRLFSVAPSSRAL